MKETNISKTIQIAVSALTKAVLFRNNTGTGWTGEKKATTSGGIYIENARPLHAGLCVGSSDLIGWNSIVITPDMVGKKVAVFTAIEVKRKKGGKRSDEQIKFVTAVEKAGGISGFPTSEEEAIELINGYPKRMINGN